MQNRHRLTPNPEHLFTKVKADGTFYSPKAGEPFPQFSEKDIDGRTWTNDSVRGHAGILLLGPAYADEHLVGNAPKSFVMKSAKRKHQGRKVWAFNVRARQTPKNDRINLFLISSRFSDLKKD